jgi:leucyl-tRNA synthetase
VLRLESYVPHEHCIEKLISFLSQSVTHNLSDALKDDQTDAYAPGKLEPRMQELWLQEGVDRVPVRDSRPTRYVLGLFPYRSGKAHLGHVLVYTISDSIARLGRYKGYRVLHPLGWDAFGLPAENAATQNKVRPDTWTALNVQRMHEQLQRRAL